MEHFYESTLVDTKEGFQCKVYSNSHPDGKIIVKPKYIPDNKADFIGLKKRYLFSKSMFRFNLFSSKEIVEKNMNEFKSKFPDYIYNSEFHNNWFFVVPKENITKYYDPKEGLKQLMNVPESDLDDYLKSTVELIGFLSKSGVSVDDFGISHSTLLGNYTPKISDIDILVFGKDNGWKVIKYLENSEHSSLKWKTEDEWAKYYDKRVVSNIYSKDEYVFNMVRKRDDGLFNGHVFSIFCVEEPNELWYNWGDKHQPLSIVKLRAKVRDNYNSIVRPGYYEVEDGEIIEGYENISIERIVTWSRPFVLQANNGEIVEACGLLEKVTPESGEYYYQLVIGYMDAYTTDRGEKEYLKVLMEN